MSIRMGAFDSDPGIRPSFRQFVTTRRPGSRSQTTGSSASPSPGRVRAFE